MKMDTLVFENDKLGNLASELISYQQLRQKTGLLMLAFPWLVLYFWIKMIEALFTHITLVSWSWFWSHYISFPKKLKIVTKILFSRRKLNPSVLLAVVPPTCFMCCPPPTLWIVSNQQGFADLVGELNEWWA